jgi:hypothetical protein
MHCLLDAMQYAAQESERDPALFDSRAFKLDLKLAIIHMKLCIVF